MSDSCRCPLTAIKPETKRISNPIHHGTNSSASANLICNVPIECMIANGKRYPAYHKNTFKGLVGIIHEYPE